MQANRITLRGLWSGLPMLTVKQAAQRAGVSESLVYEWVGSRLLAHYRFGGKGKRGKVMIEENDLDAFVASCRQKASAPVEVPPLKHIKLA